MKHGMSDTHIYNLYHHIKDRLHPSVIRNIANGKNKSGHTKDGWSFGFVSDLLE